MKNRLTRVDVNDLLGLKRPYELGVFDCSTVAFEILGRIQPKPRGAENFEELVAAFMSAGLMETGMVGADVHELGRSVDDARLLGDLVLTESPDAPAGLWTLVDEGPPRMFATATPSRGFFLSRARAIRGVTAVYRVLH